MALTITAQQVNPTGGTITRADALRLTQNSITLDGSYAAGGIPLTPQQLGHNSSVFFGTVNIRTAVAVASPGDGALDCTNPAAPKLKLIAAGALAELANGAGSGAVVDVTAFGV